MTEIKLPPLPQPWCSIYDDIDKVEVPCFSPDQLQAHARAAIALNATPPTGEVKAAQGGKTGWPAGMLQDDSRELSKWLAAKPNAKQEVRDVCATQPPEVEPAPALSAQPASDLKRFLHSAAVEGRIYDGVDAFDLYCSLYPEPQPQPPHQEQS